MRIFGKNKYKKDERGVISLGAILLLSSIIVELGLVGFLIVFLLSQSNLGIRLSAEAFVAARSGIDEGILRIIRDDYQSSFTLSVGNAAAQIDINDSNLPKVYITSEGSLFTRERTLHAVVEVDPITHLVKIESVTEIEN